MLGSSEIIETVFGKFKYLENTQSHNDFTQLVLGIAATTATTTKEIVAEALAAVGSKEALAWQPTHNGEKSIQGHRRQLSRLPLAREEENQGIMISAA